MDPKSSAVTIVLGMTKPEGEEEPKASLEYAKEILQAIKDNDAGKLAECLKGFAECCEAETYEAEES